MSRPTAAIDICNLALDRIGQAPVSSITSPTTTPEQVCARHYDKGRRARLREYMPGFAKKYKILAVDAAETPAFGYSNAYLLPSDYLRVMAFGDVSVNGDMHRGLYDIVGRHIYTDHADGTDDALDFVYIRDETNVGHWDATFIDLAVLGLAKDIAYRFSLKPSLREQIRDDYQEAAQLAAAVHSQENPPRRIERSKLRQARKMGSIYRDNRFY